MFGEYVLSRSRASAETVTRETCHLVGEETRENRSVCLETHLRAFFCFILSVTWLAAS